ncbi:hydantoinase/oxoprolinase family protein [Marinobacterium aestuariivivens]|uniref:Hydantoinase/oxoprolinase family protein n=1 Tax=Marinobacterium aestuariivivens TaxID=1698799 RepID=A0ABW1ZU98_9GAMM
MVQANQSKPTDPGQQSQWDFWIDRGGTFTDIVARCPDGTLQAHKLLSENPAHYPDAALQGIRDLLGVAKEEPLPAERIRSVKMGTTVATNALLERKGDATVLVTTRGFADALRIGYQVRPKLFDLRIELPEMLYSRVIEADERLSARGETLRRLDPQGVARALQQAYDDGLRAVAICLLHGYRYPQHEQAIARLARDIGFSQVSVSSEVSPLMKLVSRGDTTVVDAYLSPILRRYVDRVASELGNTRLMFMQSHGGLTDAHFFQGKDAILSGPAGGVVSMAHTASLAGFDKVIGFDMGGTSTDVSHYNGEYERTFESEVAGVRLRAPMMQIHTVAAGGGSVLHFDGARYRVGPDSAGAAPGPACYRKNGPLTVTDCNLMLGRLQPAFFPKVFGPNADQPLDADVVREKFSELARRIRRETGDERTPEQVAEGFLSIAVENMANAIKHISVQRGYDVSEYVLNCFGGASGQLACQVADALGMKWALLHPYSGVLSAYGIGLADVRLLRQQAVEVPLSDSLIPQLDALFDQLAASARQEMTAQRVPAERTRLIRKLHVKYAGSDTTLMVPYGQPEQIVESFEETHNRQYGFIAPDKKLVIEAALAELVGTSDLPPDTSDAPRAPRNPAAIPVAQRAQVMMAGEWRDTTIYDRTRLQPGDRIEGPAIIIEANSTTVIEPGWQGEMDSHRQLVLHRIKPLPRQTAIGTEVDPVMLEIFNNLFMSIAEQMGSVLENTASSVNIKERLDFSCALFDRDGELIANAPHMPVHLGSMSESIKSVIRSFHGRMHDGDAYMLNAPYNGGTHLPDVTVIRPVFYDDEIQFYVASRGHHADIGGITPAPCRRPAPVSSRRAC